MIEILLALIAGVLTIAAPCILLPLPILLGGSVGHTSKTRPLFITLGFVVTFAGLALAINFLVQSLGLDPGTLRTAAVALLAIFAFFMIWPTPFEKLTSHLSGLITKASQTGRTAGNGNFGGLVMGVVLGVIWAPCAGPILGSILTLIAQQADLARAGLLLTAYSIGAGLPMLAIAYGGQALTTKVKIIAQYSTRLQQIFGIILLLLAVAIYFQYDTKFQAYLVSRFPVLNSAVEEKILNKLDNMDMEENSFNANSNLSPQTSSLPVLGAAPEFTDIATWLNSDPLTLQDLKGKVVLIDFWTYSCINCIRTLPYVTSWYETYKDQGLVVVGVHTPEFAFEKDTDNVKRAIAQHNINYPVAQDNDYGTWLAYANRYWPAHYLIDQEGKVRYTHFGEGQYEETEGAIRALLGTATTTAAPTPEQSNSSNIRSPEMYFGQERLKNLHPEQKASTKETPYTLPKNMLPNSFALEGTWVFDDEKATLKSNTGKVRLYFAGNEVNLVAKASPESHLTSLVQDQEVSQVDVTRPNLYNVFKSDMSGEYIIDIFIENQGFELYTFTFGS